MYKIEGLPGDAVRTAAGRVSGMLEENSELVEIANRVLELSKMDTALIACLMAASIIIIITLISTFYTSVSWASAHTNQHLYFSIASLLVYAFSILFLWFVYLFSNRRMTKSDDPSFKHNRSLFCFLLIVSTIFFVSGISCITWGETRAPFVTAGGLFAMTLVSLFTAIGVAFYALLEKKADNLFIIVTVALLLTLVSLTGVVYGMVREIPDS